MQSIFRIFNQNDFRNFILNSNFSRSIKIIQNHHTWLPNYKNLENHRDEMYWLESMRTSHIRDRKWKEIGQNITTFPSGNIAICRPIDTTPAGIYGANTGAICIEHFGNFDKGGDVMTEEHKSAIVQVNAILCHKFGLAPSTETVVYHHWYDTSGRRFERVLVDNGTVQEKKLQKSCPGTNFFLENEDDFAGNTILAAKKNFYPKIEAVLQDLKQKPLVNQPVIQKQVIAQKLNVRSGASLSYPVIKILSLGTLVSIYENVEGWSRISLTGEEWVSSNYIN